MVQPISIRDSLSFDTDKAINCPADKQEHLQKWQTILDKIPAAHKADTDKVKNKVTEIQSLCRKSNIKLGLLIAALSIVGIAAVVLGLGLAIGSVVGGIILLNTCLAGGIVLMSAGEVVGGLMAAISAVLVGSGPVAFGLFSWRPKEVDLEQIISGYSLEDVDFRNADHRDTLQELMESWNNAKKEVRLANEAFKTSDYSRFENHIAILDKHVEKMNKANQKLKGAGG